MKYSSTRGNKQEMTSAEAIIAGLAEDGGLFVPGDLPRVDMEFISSLQNMSYQQRAAKVLSLFLTDYTSEEIEGCVSRAYGNHKFDAAEVAPVASVGDFSVLELWHGPTSAFKDMALQLLPQLMSTALRKVGDKHQILILVATSGDTGKAALEGFKDVEQIKIQVFYPDGGVSKIQRLQMVTQQGGNVAVVAVKGNFDDAQSGVKAIFGNTDFAVRLAKANTKLSSANSINWGRLVPQIVYYFSAYADLCQAGKVKAGEKVNFTVPTGNFGNILAGFYAWQMGLPVGKLICASNTNNVLTDFLQTGKYDKNREFYKTITPSMDILISSNLERLLYHLSGDRAAVHDWMQALNQDGHYTVGADMLPQLKNYFWADWADDAKTSETIKRVYAAKNYVLDPHTAVAWTVAEAYRKETGDKRPMVIVSTASPYKFNDSVLRALDAEPESNDPFVMLDRLEDLNAVKAPKGLAGLRKAEVRHDKVVEKNSMQDAVFAFASQA